MNEELSPPPDNQDDHHTFTSISTATSNRDSEDKDPEDTRTDDKSPSDRCSQDSQDATEKDGGGEPDRDPKPNPYPHK